MWRTLTWRDLETPEMAGEVADFREGMLRLFLALAALAYVTWHFTITSIVPPDGDLPYWRFFPVPLAALGGTYLLLQARSRVAAGFFVVSSAAAITIAIWLVPAPSATFLYPILVLVAVALLRPLAGLAVCTGSLAALTALWRLTPQTQLGGERVLETCIASGMTLVAAWALARSLIVAVGWALHSYHQAAQNAESARTHRAELARALKQLDLTNYRLQRANAALELAWKAADTAERSKTEFVLNISHELRTPLNLVVGFSEMILTAPESYGVALPAVYRGDLNAVYRSAQHLLMLTNDVIDLTRVGIGRLALSREPLPLGQIVGDACDIVREYVTAKGLRLVVDVPPAVPVLSIDRLRIRQVLLNLLTNAARFTERGSITVSASLVGTSVLVKVVDSGRGIAPVDLGRVFEEFHHDASDQPPVPGRFGGIGLGLPISKRFVELHGGQMGVESVPGVGTTFWFTLLGGDDAALPAPPERSGRRLEMAPASERVLVLSDGDEQLAQFLQRHLRDCRVVAASGLANAVSAAIECRAVAILADGEGRDAESHPELPVPLLRLPLPHGERLAAALGAAAYLVKPVTRARLSAVIAGLGRPINTVLIVDDDHRFVRLLTRMLLALSNPPAILSAHSATEALDQLKGAKPDLLLLDLVLPDGGGADVLRSMATSPDLAGVPVIVITGQDQIDGRLPLAGRMTVEKPDGFRLEELLNAVEALLGLLDPPRRYLGTAIALMGQ